MFQAVPDKNEGKENPKPAAVCVAVGFLSYCVRGPRCAHAATGGSSYCYNYLYSRPSLAHATQAQTRAIRSDPELCRPAMATRVWLTTLLLAFLLVATPFTARGNSSAPSPLLPRFPPLRSAPLVVNSGARSVRAASPARGNGDDRARLGCGGLGRARLGVHRWFRKGLEALVGCVEWVLGSFGWQSFGKSYVMRLT